MSWSTIKLSLIHICTAQFSIFAYQVSSPSSAFSIGVKKSLNIFDGFFCKRSNWEQDVYKRQGLIDVNYGLTIYEGANKTSTDKNRLRCIKDIPLN